MIATLCVFCKLAGWRQSNHNIKTVKKLFRKTQQLKRSTSKDPEKKKQRAKLIIEAHQQYIDVSVDFVKRTRKTLTEANSGGVIVIALMIEIEKYLAHADRQIDQIKRRVIDGGKIPHSEKVFSIFEEHTEWISKGKAGVPVELGLKVCVLEDQYGFILHHQVMQNKTDDQVAVAMVKQAKEYCPNLISCSFDKGFHSPANQKDLLEELDFVVLPRKGKLSQKNKEREHSAEFVKARHQHSAVESAINALGVHGLDRCLDHGLDGFTRYVSLAILGRNTQQLGEKLRQQELESQQKEEELRQVA